MCGITLTTYTSYCKKTHRPLPDKDDLKRLTKEDWEDIYKRMFWDSIKGDAIESQSVANGIIDWYWMSGITAIKRVQTIVGATADGIVGPQTIAAINAVADQRSLFFQIRQARLNHVEMIVRNAPSQRVFLQGWRNRINALNYIE